MFEIDNTRKHYIPRFYLRGFSRNDKPNQIYVFDKKAPEKGIQNNSLTNLEVSKDAYSTLHDSFIRQKESVWAGIFNSIKSTSAVELNELIADREQSAPIRVWLAHFVIDIFLRSRGLRERNREVFSERWRSTQKKIDEIFDELDDKQMAKETGVPKEDVKKIVNQGTHVDDYEKWLAVTLYPALPKKDGEYYDCLPEGSWRFDNPQESRKFITSDIPSTILRLGPEYPNWIWFTVPIRETLILSGCCGDARMDSGLLPRYNEMSNEEIDRTNGLMFDWAERFVYSSSKDEIRQAVKRTRDQAP